MNYLRCPQVHNFNCPLVLPWNEKTLAFDVHCRMVEIPFHIRHRDGLNLSQRRALLSLRPRNQDHPQSAEDHQVCLQCRTSSMDMSGGNSSGGRLRTGEREIKAFLFRYRPCHSSKIQHAAWRTAPLNKPSSATRSAILG